MWRAALSLLLMGCGPVLIGEQSGAPQAGAGAGSDGGVAPGEAGSNADASLGPAGAGQPDAGAPAVAVRIEPVACGQCFELRAQASGGQPPYDFEWSDGVLGAARSVCTGGVELSLSVIARDAGDARSARQAIQLQGAGDASCPDAGDGATTPVTSRLCLENPSFEGPPTTSFGQGLPFEAAPWTTCTNPPTSTNAPAIGNDTTSVTGAVPPPQDGATYLGLGEGQQVSQALCAELVGETHLQLDLARIDLGGDLVPQTEQVHLQLWGGLSADCSTHQLLWASEALQAGWKTYCVTLRPHDFMNQLTLRAASDMSLPNPAFLIVDNLQPVDSCP